MASKLFMPRIAASRITSLLACAALFSMHLTVSATVDTETLLKNGNWEAAARAVFAEAKMVQARNMQIFVSQARARFLEDALYTVAEQYQESTAWALMQIIERARSLSLEQRNELAHMALKSARRSQKTSDLTRIANYYAQQGEESEARNIYVEALNAAENALEKGERGYRVVTKVLRDAPFGPTMEWMLDLLAPRLERMTNSVDLALSCANLVAVAGQIGRQDLVGHFVTCGKDASEQIDDEHRKTAAQNALASAAGEAGYLDEQLPMWPHHRAIRESRSGNPGRAYSIVSKLGRSLYMDGKSYAYWEVFNDAMERGDIETATYFANRPVREVVGTNVRVWQELAEMQAQRGDQQAAERSYSKALSALYPLPSHVFYTTVYSVLHLGESMQRHGLVDEGRQVILSAMEAVDKIEKRRMVHRARGSLAVAESLWQLGMHEQAREVLVDAYRLARDIPDNDFYAGKKAYTLATIAEAMVSFSRMTQ